MASRHQTAKRTNVQLSLYSDRAISAIFSLHLGIFQIWGDFLIWGRFFVFCRGGASNRGSPQPRFLRGAASSAPTTTHLAPNLECASRIFAPELALIRVCLGAFSDICRFKFIRVSEVNLTVVTKIWYIPTLLCADSASLYRYRFAQVRTGVAGWRRLLRMHQGKNI